MTDVTDDMLAGPANPALVTNQPFPGSSGGMIETTKRAIIGALRDALTDTSLNGLVSGARITVDMEYPMVPEKYPGIWVQFSFTELNRAGIGMELMNKEVITPATDTTPEVVVWEPLREFIFKGRATLTVVALTSLERDRLADGIITMLMFSRPPEQVITQASQDTKQFRAADRLPGQKPYISMTPITTMLNCRADEAMTTGVPWQADLMAYADSYSFDIEGQTNILFKHDGSYLLSRIDLAPDAEPPSPFTWQ